MDLKNLGWNNFFAEHFATFSQGDFVAARVASEFKNSYRLYSEFGELHGEVSGKLRHQALQREDYPAVGDWVVIQPRIDDKKATIHAILPRISKFSRKIAGLTTEEQIIATNINTVFLVNALNNDFNLRRLERYLILAWESGANPVIILSKADLCSNLDKILADVEAIAFGVPIHIISSYEKRGLDELTNYLQVGHTIALLGSSGVGKSTLINQLYGEEIQAVKEIRADDAKGKHTTTNRELIVLPQGGIIIDTPGMRELQLWEGDNSLANTFQDIEQLAENCHFLDCRHNGEPNCAVKIAIEENNLDIKRFNNYQKMQKELTYFARKEDQRAQLIEKNKWKQISKSSKQYRK